MSRRESTLLLLKDVLGHLTACQRQLEWATDKDTIQVLTETMLRDLDCCRRLCETLYQRAGIPHAVS